MKARNVAGVVVDDRHDNSSSNHAASKSSPLRFLLLDLPLWILALAFAFSQAANRFYQGPMQHLIESFRRHEGADHYGYYNDFLPDITYYGRQCDERDITTTDSNDLVVPPMSEPEVAEDIMMKHGAILVKDILSNETASELRRYLETRNVIRDQLPWHEMFWGDIDRLALGLGTDDHPAIAKAMEEVGQSETLRRALTGILGPDPAIVEASTLTAMHGCQDQGIHSDSDFFGSSLLYSRTFLHSYTLFMALQDTSSMMGSTTVCPGTQWCANEELGDVCHANGAFEASSNGQTGIDTGMIMKGDGMMFNQNVWHRGPKNFDPERPLNRVMFILTFVSRKELEAGDVRQQGLGTYYYQRWNMWGHTFEDLKHAAKTMLFSQPIAGLKALGLWKWPGTNWGIPWLEHYARQLANNEDFYADYELPDFVQYLDTLGVPKWLQGGLLGERQRHLQDFYGTHDEEMMWEPFVKNMFARATNFFTQLHVAGVLVYLGINYFLSLLRRSPSEGNDLPAAFGRVFSVHFKVGLLTLGLWYYVTQWSYLGHRIQQRDTWSQPFAKQTDMSHLKKSTMPTRADVLVGSRFDAPYLASFNHVLDYHPGNVAFAQALEDFPESPAMIRAFFAQPVDAVTPRFLQQDWKTGFWTIMESQDVDQYIATSMASRREPIKAKLDEHLREMLADARFGLRREEAMTAKHTPAFVAKWQSVLFHNSAKAPSAVPSSVDHLPRSKMMGPVSLASKLEPSASPILKESSSIMLLSRSGSPNLGIGDVVLARWRDTNEFWEGRIVYADGGRFVHIEYAHPEGKRYGAVSADDVQPYQSVVQGDTLLSDFQGELWPVKVERVHPLGHCVISYDDGEDGVVVEEKVPLEALLFPTANAAPIQASVGQLEVGQSVMANFQGNGEWFLAQIREVNGDGTYAIDYEDGDFEPDVEMELLRPLL
eukprot:Nitzschia sp. Nitz4//scaffold87_size112219//8629//11542//NITZ4_004058-RA/size112219-augustus-gene-0.56-mRNA-1//-1//CDS//3329559321//8353//frame0